MKISSKNELKDELDKDLSWRKRELTAVLNNVNTTVSKTLQLSLRTAILLLYAHWEGFVKKAAEVYLCFVKYQYLKLNELQDNFVAIALKQKLMQFRESNKSTIHSQFITFIRHNMTDVSDINEEGVINAMSNLNSAVLKQILVSIGVDYTFFELKENLIDKQLLNYRNTVAHGEYLVLDVNEYKIIHNEVLLMINEIKTSIENAVILEEYKIKPSPSAQTSPQTPP